MPTKLPSFDHYARVALADGRITIAEAKKLTSIANQHLAASKNPGPTLDMYGDKLAKLESKGTDDGARFELGYWKQFVGNTAVQQRAQKSLTQYLRTHQGHADSPFTDAIALDPNTAYHVVYDPMGEELIPGGIQVSDNASDAYYLAIPVDVTKLGMSGNEGTAELDRVEGMAQVAVEDMIHNSPELKWSGAEPQVILVQPKA